MENQNQQVSLGKKEWSWIKSILVFVGIVILAFLGSGIPLLGQGYFSLESSAIALILGSVSAVIYIKTRSKKYLWILAAFVGLSSLIVALPVKYPLCTLSTGMFGGVSSYDCDCIGLKRLNFFGNTECIGVRSRCYNDTKHRTGTSEQDIYTKDNWDADESEARQYFENKLKTFYGISNGGKFKIVSVQKMKEVADPSDPESSCHEEASSDSCEQDYLSSKMAPKIRKYTEFKAQMEMKCSTVDSQAALY